MLPKLFVMEFLEDEIKLLNNYYLFVTSQNSPPNLSSLSNAPGTPHDDGEIPAGFLNAFPSDGVRPFTPARNYPALLSPRRGMAANTFSDLLERRDIVLMHSAFL